MSQHLLTTKQVKPKPAPNYIKSIINSNISQRTFTSKIVFGSFLGKFTLRSMAKSKELVQIVEAVDSSSDIS